MKKNITLLLLFLFTVYCYAQEVSPSIIIGTWQSNFDDENTFGTLIFNANGSVVIEAGEVILNEENGIGKGKFAQMIYKLDITKIPHQLDIMMTNNETKSDKTILKAIVQFTSKNKMKIAIDLIDRPLEFSSENSMSFSRIR